MILSLYVQKYLVTLMLTLFSLQQEETALWHTCCVYLSSDLVH